MSLSFRPDTGDFFLLAESRELRDAAERTGLTLSTTASRRGTPTYYTRCEYAALPFWQHGDERARRALAGLREEYEASWLGDASYQPPAPPGCEYYAFQRAGIAYALRHGNALIGDQPGLGKTIQAIGVANSIDARRVLVVCPGKVRLQWVTQIRHWSTISPRPRVSAILKGRDGVDPYAHYVVISYDLARSEGIHRQLCALDYDLLVLDESHYLKTPEASRTRAVFGGGEGRYAGRSVAERASRIVGLTGTPLPNRPRECYTIVRALCWDAIDWMSREKFDFFYNPSYKHPTGHVEERRGRLPELQARLRCNLMVRRLKRDVQRQLPSVTWELAYVEEDAKIRRVLRAESLLGIDPLELDPRDADAMGQVSTVRREMGEAKAPRVAEHVDMLLDGGVEKLVVFFHHRSVGDVLEERFRRWGVARVDGRTSTTRQNALVRQFVDGDETRVFLGNLEAAGTGVDRLQEVCSHVVFAEASWVPKDNEQAVDRLHRIGQSSAVVAQFLVAPGSFDERVLSVAVEKRLTIHESLDRVG